MSLAGVAQGKGMGYDGSNCCGSHGHSVQHRLNNKWKEDCDIIEVLVATFKGYLTMKYSEINRII